jgi:hypothetical protein
LGLAGTGSLNYWRSVDTGFGHGRSALELRSQQFLDFREFLDFSETGVSVDGDAAGVHVSNSAIGLAASIATATAAVGTGVEGASACFSLHHDELGQR